MHFLVIACDVLTREVCHCVARSPHVVDLQFTPKASHDDSDYLRGVLQEKVDAAEESGRKYDAVLLCFGLCGNSTIGVTARSAPIVVPRAHDCCTLFLGSKEKFKEHFGDNPSSGFSASGYMERGGSRVREASGTVEKLGLDKDYASYVEMYGEEHAKFIWETLHPPVQQSEEKHPLVFINIPETSFLGHADVCRQEAEKNGTEFVCLEGSMRLVEKLLFGDWPADEFLVVEPGQRITGVYDWDHIIAVEKAPEA